MQINTIHNRGLPWHVLGILLAVALATPVWVTGSTDSLQGTEAFEQEFIITAYYSPIPGQCCYVLGGLRADRVLNGEGHTAANGTAVYPGMIAAPQSYPFGTRVALPGIGTLTVHDRGGAIVEKEDGTHRLDIWVGHGEEGLARALSFGVRRVRGVVYPNGAVQPPESFSLDAIPTFFERLGPYMVEDGNFLAVRPKAGDRGPSVSMLQEYLQRAGYFGRASTGIFGSETQQALAAFTRDFLLDEPTDVLTERTAVMLFAAAIRSDAPDPVRGFVDTESPPSINMQAQRILRFLGYYQGRTDGQYSDALASAILKFQQEHWLVGTAEDPGAGRIGPITSRAIQAAWNRTLVARMADRFLDRRRIENEIAERGEVIDRYLEEGDGYSEVRKLQQLLADRGYFPQDRITGYFGPETKQAVLQYQVETGLIAGVTGEGAGRVGPATLRQLKLERVNELYRLIRAEGWHIF